MTEAPRYEVRIDDQISGSFESMADALADAKRAFEAIEASGAEGYARIDALFPTEWEAQAFAGQFAKSAKVLVMPNRIHLEPVDSEAFSACVWADYDPQRDGVSNEAAHRRFASIRRTTNKWWF